MKAPIRAGSKALGLALLLLAAPAAAQEPQEEARKELQAIEKELQEEYKHLRQATRLAADDEAASALYRDFQESLLPEFAERFAAVARAHRSTDVALSAWMKVCDLVQQGLTGEVAREALTALTTDHLQSPKLAAFAASLRYGAPAFGEETALATLRTLAERSPHRGVQAAALYSLGAVLGEDRPAGDPRIAEAKAVFARLPAYADVEQYEGKTYADAAAAFVFALDNLVVGKPCPDFEAVDAEGVPFKLSDYQGKVVLIDFWGFW